MAKVTFTGQPKPKDAPKKWEANNPKSIKFDGQVFPLDKEVDYDGEQLEKLIGNDHFEVKGEASTVPQE